MKLFIRIGMVVGLFMVVMICCKPTQAVMSKSGNELWAQSCTRCHYAPPSVDFDDHEWDLIGMHMQIKAQLTSDEIHKITAYLKDSN